MSASSFLVLVGSFSPMISTLNFTTSPPSLTLVSQTASGTSPSWLLSNPTNSSIFYATDEVVSGGSINSLLVDHDTGKITPVASISTKGGSPTHLGMVDNGTQIGAANFGGKSAFFASLEPDQLHFTDPQLVQFTGVSNSNPHQIVSFGDQTLVSDLGADRVWRLVHDESAKWSVQDFISQPTGSGPRHIIVDDGSLFVLHELDSTLTQQTISPSSTDVQPDSIASISIIPSDTTNTSSLHAGELLFSSTPTPLLYASNRDDPSPQGDAIAIFQLDPLKKVAEVRTGLKHLRGVAFLGENEEFLVVGGMNGGGIKVYERVGESEGWLKEVVHLQEGVVDQPSSFIWIAPSGTTTTSGTVTGSVPTATASIVPTQSHSGSRRRYHFGR